jgi:hypothetical protein
MNGKYLPSERGQALVLIILGFVVLMGFTALAVDGSMLYSDRRYAQNAADAASLAGAGAAALYLEENNIIASNWSCSGGAINAGEFAAKNRAVTNGFTIDFDLSDDHGVDAYCGVENHPPYSKNYIDVRVRLTMPTKAQFVQFVYKGPLVNTVEAVTRIYPRRSLAWGEAIVALNDKICDGNVNGIQFRGDLTLNVVGGGVFSNGCLDVDGGNYPNICNGDLNFFYGGNFLDNIEFYDMPCEEDVDENSQTYSDLDDSMDERIPYDSYFSSTPVCDSSNTISANTFEGSTGLTGLICVTGDVKINTAPRSVQGTDVTIVMLGGKFDISGGMSSLQAPPSDGSYITGIHGTAIPGLLIYMPVEYYGPWDSGCGLPENELQINGNAMNAFVGTILAPCTDVSLEGGGDTFAYQSQVIGWNVNSGGTADLNVIYDEGKNFSKPTWLDFYR